MLQCPFWIAYFLKYYAVKLFFEEVILSTRAQRHKNIQEKWKEREKSFFSTTQLSPCLRATQRQALPLFLCALVTLWQIFFGCGFAALCYIERI
jgi:hypothetical protein